MSKYVCIHIYIYTHISIHIMHNYGHIRIYYIHIHCLWSYILPTLHGFDHFSWFSLVRQTRFWWRGVWIVGTCLQSSAWLDIGSTLWTISHACLESEATQRPNKYGGFMKIMKWIYTWIFPYKPFMWGTNSGKPSDLTDESWDDFNSTEDPDHEFIAALWSCWMLVGIVHTTSALCRFLWDCWYLLVTSGCWLWDFSDFLHALQLRFWAKQLDRRNLFGF